MNYIRKLRWYEWFIIAWYLLMLSFVDNFFLGFVSGVVGLFYLGARLRPHFKGES